MTSSRTVTKKEQMTHLRNQLRNAQGVSVKARAKEKVKVSLKVTPWPDQKDEDQP